MAHLLLTSFLRASNSSTTAVLQADLGTAAAAYLRQCSLLPATVLLDLAAGCGRLLCEDGSASVPAVLDATAAAPLQLSAAQPVLVTCTLDVRSGTAEVAHNALQQMLLSYTYGSAAAATASQSASQQAQAVSASALLCTGIVQLELMAEQPPCTASLAAGGHDTSGCQLPLSLCEAAGALASAAGLASSGVLASCIAFVPHPWAQRGRQQLVLFPGTNGLDVSASCGSDRRIADLCGLALQPAEPAEHASEAYTLVWKRMATGEADAE